jgi:DNA end-binding protein Ku
VLSTAPKRVEDEELEALDPKKSREIDLAQFVALEALGPLHFEQSCFLVPDGGTTKA